MMAVIRLCEEPTLLYPDIITRTLEFNSYGSPRTQMGDLHVMLSLEEVEAAPAVQHPRPRRRSTAADTPRRLPPDITSSNAARRKPNTGPEVDSMVLRSSPGRAPMARQRAVLAFNPWEPHDSVHASPAPVEGRHLAVEYSSSRGPPDDSREGLGYSVSHVDASAALDYSYSQESTEVDPVTSRAYRQGIALEHQLREHADSSGFISYHDFKSQRDFNIALESICDSSEDASARKVELGAGTPVASRQPLGLPAPGDGRSFSTFEQLLSGVSQRSASESDLDQDTDLGPDQDPNLDLDLDPDATCQPYDGPPAWGESSWPAATVHQESADGAAIHCFRASHRAQRRAADPEIWIGHRAGPEQGRLSAESRGTAPSPSPAMGMLTAADAVLVATGGHHARLEPPSQPTLGRAAEAITLHSSHARGPNIAPSRPSPPPRSSSRSQHQQCAPQPTGVCSSGRGVSPQERVFRSKLEFQAAWELECWKQGEMSAFVARLQVLQGPGRMIRGKHGIL